MITPDDTRRALETAGLTSGRDRTDATQAALDAYGEIWAQGKGLQCDHEQALQAVIVAVAPFLKGK